MVFLNFDDVISWTLQSRSAATAASRSSIILGPERMAAISAICHKTWRLPVLPSLIIESSWYPLGCDPPYLAVGAGKSNNCSKEPIKASKSFIVPRKALIIPYSDSYTLHNGSQSLLIALNTREARTQLITGSYQLSSALLVMLLRA